MIKIVQKNIGLKKKKWLRKKKEIYVVRQIAE